MAKKTKYRILKCVSPFGRDEYFPQRRNWLGFWVSIYGAMAEDPGHPTYEGALQMMEEYIKNKGGYTEVIWEK